VVEEDWRPPGSSPALETGELEGQLVCCQDAVGLAAYDVVRGDHLDWFEAQSAAGGKEAADPLGLGSLRTAISID
jgi:hypothetical protein